jgi:hypothetical protein
VTSMTGLDSIRMFSHTGFRVLFVCNFFASAFSLASVADVVLAAVEKSEASAQCPQVTAQRVLHPRSCSALKSQHPTVLHLFVSAFLPLDFMSH